MEVSIIIPSHNSSKTIIKILDSIKHQIKVSNIIETIIVDSSSDLETKKILSEYLDPRLKIINLGDKIIPALARNLGAKEARGEILVFLDADAIPADDWIEKIINAYKAGCLIGGGSISLPSFQKYSLVPMAQLYLQFNEYLNTGQIKQKLFVPSCNMYCDKSIFYKYNGFPKIRAAEDVLFGLKIGKNNTIYFIPEARVYHIFRENIKDFLKNQILLGKYNILYRRAYYDTFLYRGIIPLILLPFIICIKLLLIIFRVSKAGLNHVLSLVCCFPLFLLGLLCWSIGFAEGIIKYHVEEN